jgi:hypothetical protein
MSRMIWKCTTLGQRPFLVLSLLFVGVLGLFASLGSAGSQAVPSAEVAPPPRPDPVAEWIDQEGSFDYAAAVNALLGRSVTPQTNAIVLIWQALGPTPEGGSSLPAEYFEYLGCPRPAGSKEDFIKLYRYAGEVLRLPERATEQLYDQLFLLAAIPWKDKEAPELADWLRRNEKALERLQQAAERPHYFNPAYKLRDDGTTISLFDNLLPHIQALREAALAFSLRAMNKLGNGDTAGAWQDILTAYRLSRHLAQGMWIIEGLVGVALETGILFKTTKAFLEHAALPPRQLAECLRQLRALPEPDWITHRGVIVEMAAVLDHLQHKAPKNYAEAIKGMQASFNRPFPPLPRQLEEVPITVEGWVTLQRELITRYLRWGDYLRQHGNKPYDPTALEALRPDPKVLEELGREIEREIAAWKKEEGQDAARAWRLQEMTGRYAGMTLFFMSSDFLPKFHKTHLRRKQCGELLQAAIALELYRCEQGRYPRQLQELAGKYLPEVPLDRFRNQPLVYQVSPEMVLVYSVGPNGRDDAARSYLDDPNEREADDLVVRWRPRLKP